MGCASTKVQAAEVVEAPEPAPAAPAPESVFRPPPCARVSFTAGRGSIQPMPSAAMSTRQLSRMRHAKLADFEPISKLGQGAFGVVLLVRLSSVASELRERGTETHVLDEAGRSLQVRAGRGGPAPSPGATGIDRADAAKDGALQIESESESDKEEALFAMKVMAAQDLVDAEMVTRVVAEKEILQRLHHPFIVRLHFAFMSPKASQVFLVMEAVLGGELFAMMARLGFLVDTTGTARFDPLKVCGAVSDAYRENTAGVSLRGWLPAEVGGRRGMPESWVRFYTAEIACALFHLHRHGVLYRDLKPENVMLRLNGHIALTDFGLAMDRDEEEGQGEIAGTLPYLAPDMLGDDLPTEAVDWWSLGFLMHEMMWGRPPFGTRVLSANENQLQRKRREQMRLILFEPLVLPGRGTLPQPSEAACDIVRRLLIRDCRKRLGSGAGAELAQPPRRRSVVDYMKESWQNRLSNRRNSGSQAPRIPDSEMSAAEQAARRMAARMGDGGAAGQGQPQVPRGTTMIEGRGFHEIEGHPFFGEIDMRLLLAQAAQPPWLPLSTHQSSHAAKQMSKEMAQRYTGVGEDGAEDTPSAGEGEGSEEREADLVRLREQFKAFTAAPVTKLVVQEAVAATKSRNRRQSAPMVYTGSADTKRLRLTQVF